MTVATGVSGGAPGAGSSSNAASSNAALPRHASLLRGPFSRLVWRDAAFVAAGAMLPLLHGLAGMERYVIVLFPVFAAWATVGGRRTQAVLFGASLLGLTLGATMFFAGYTLT